MTTLVVADVAGQNWDAREYARNGRFVADLAASLVEWLEPQAGERILDLGCGDGALTEKLAASGATVVGIDASAELVTAARERGIDARLADAQALTFSSEFDAVFSNAAMHWMKRDPDGVLAGVARALKPGGRFVAELGAAGNIAAIRGAIHDVMARRGYDATRVDPWFFPTLADYRRRLQAAGFDVVAIESFPRPTLLPGDIGGWMHTFGQAFLAIVPEGERGALIAEIQDSLRDRLANTAGQWTVDYVRLRFMAVKKAR